MGNRTSQYNSLSDPYRDPEVVLFMLMTPNPEVPNIANWDDQDIDFEFNYPVDTVDSRQLRLFD